MKTADRDRSPDRPGGRIGERPSDRLARWGPAIAVLVLHLAFAPSYGIFRDELYYLSCARRLAWGYVDHPPLIAALTALWTSIFGDGLRALRLLPALAAAAAAWVTGSTARAMRGGPFAVAVAGFAYGFAPVVLSLGSVLSMNALDLLFWAVLVRLLAALLAGGSERLWWAFGAVAGAGLLNKSSVLFLGFGVVAGLVAARRWEVFRSPSFWGGGALAALLLLPHLLWQRTHGWPTLEFMENAQESKNVALAPLDFLGSLVGNSGPVQVVLWLIGLGALIFSPALRRFRPLGFSVLAILAVMLSTAAKPYYFSPSYTILAAAGAVALEASSARWRRTLLLRGAFSVLLIGLSAMAAPFARPILPVETYVRYAAWLGETPGTDERKEVGRLPQFYADMQEWREMAQSVARAAAKLSLEERREACVFGQNYGEAGAVEYFGRELGLPPAFSGHNSWFLWGLGRCGKAAALVVMGNDRERLAELFEEVELGATFDCRDCMPYEDDLPVWIVRRPRQDLAALWPRIKNFS
jgi:hypothetical protein